jgi:iron complex outermembrane receptor protein
MFRKTQVCRAALLALAGVGAVTALPVQAQQTLEKVEITGSAIKRIVEEGALPVQTFTREEIERSGAQTVVELVQTMSSMQGFSTSSQAVGASAASISTASVHGIGESRTLVLLNGHRIAKWAGQSLTGSGAAIDLNTLPLSAIERVEVLTDGASALYGADAVAGVINFILKTNQTDANISLTHSVPDGSVGKNTAFSLSKGWGDLRADGYNVLIAFSQDEQDRLKASDRSFSKTGVIPFKQGGQNYVFFNGSIRSAPANWIIADPATGGDVYFNLGNPYLSANGACPPGHVLDDPLCRFDYAKTVEIFPESKRQNALATFSKKFGEHTFSTDLVWSKYDLTARIAPPPVDMVIPTGSALYNKYMPGGANVLDPGSTYGDDLYAYWRGVDAGNRTTQDKTEALHLDFSLKGALAGWDYNTAVIHSENKWDENYLGGWLMQNEQDAAIAGGLIDPFLGAGQQDPNVIAGMQYKGAFKSGKATLDMFELRGSRDVFKIGPSSAQLAAGIGFGREQFKYTPSNIAQGIGNNIAGDTSQERPYDVTRNAWGLFGELLVPVVKGVEVTGALRHDHYDDFGDTTNYKLAARYQPARNFLMRASLGSGFKAPSVPQVSAGQQLYGVTGNQYNCPTIALAEVRKTYPDAQCRIDGSQYEIFASGNKDLKPEKSDQWAVGFQVEPTEWSFFGADLWSVRIKDRINQLAEDVVMGDQAAYLKNFTVFNDPGTGNTYVALYLPNENLGDEKFMGIDVEGRLLFQTPVGKLRTALHWTHMLKHDYQRLKGGDWFSNLGKFNDNEVTFRDQVKLIFNLDYGKFAHTLTASWKSSYRDYQCTVDDCGSVYLLNPDGSLGSDVDMLDHQVDSYYTFDWQTQYQHSKNLGFVIGIINIANQKPPFTIQTYAGHQIGYDNRYADPRGRIIYGSLNLRF